MRSVVRGWSTGLALTLCLAMAVPVAGQAPNRNAALTVIPPGHWIRTVARRVDAARLTEPGFDAYAATLTVGHVATLVGEAAGRAEAADHPLQLQLLDWLARLRAEYPDAFAEAAPGTAARLVGAVGITANQNPLRPRDASGRARYDADTLSVFGAVRAEATLAGRIHLAADVAATHDHAQLREGYATSRIGSVGLWAGRRRTGVVSMVGGGMVVNDVVAWDGGGVWLAHPVEVPLLGRVNFESFLAAGSPNGRVPEPWFWLTRGTVEPLPRFTIGATRAILFGDTAGGRAIDWGELGKILVGQNSLHERDAAYPDNQVLAVDGRWRTPLQPVPVELYLTWGAEDSSGAWWKSPAIIGGIFVPVLPGLPAVSLGLEHAVFSGARGHGHFYEHASFTNGWAEDGRLIGHPLGGTGREWLVYGGLDRGVAGPAIEGRAFRRVRPAGNRLSPERAGTSWGGEGDVVYDVLPSIRIRLHGALELGTGWKTGAASAALEWRGSLP